MNGRQNWRIANPARWRRRARNWRTILKIRSALQFAFYEQWQALRRYCAERKIRIVGDVAIFVNYDSADVWMHRDLFRLNENLEPEVVSGVPPDFFSKTGQRWGNPLYRWDVMKAQGYEWWIQRLRWATRNCDYIRLDHFRGFDQFWEIPAAIQQRSTGAGWMVRATTCFTSCARRWGAAVLRGRSGLHHAGGACSARDGCRFREWRCCNSASATRARTCICRIAPRAR
jgi:4-alpha-glucanotransferase